MPCIQDAIEQREQAQKVALEALRNASATENVARIYKYVCVICCSSILAAIVNVVVQLSPNFDLAISLVASEQSLQDVLRAEQDSEAGSAGHLF